MRLIDFCRSTWPKAWDVNWHTELICENLELLERGEIPNLMLWAPPRHSKSIISTVYYPIYCLLNDPHAKFICVTHADDLARSAARAARDLLLSPFCQREAPYKLRVAGDAKWMIDFPESNSRHSYIGVSIEGQLTGEGCTRLLADDLLKGASEAWSPTVREKVWQTYLTAAETRCAPGGRQVITATRWSLDDPCGRLLIRAQENPLATQWRVLALAATNDSGQESYILDTWKPASEAQTLLPAYRALWPRQFSREVLDQKRANLLPSHWSALYQQAPLCALDQMFGPACWAVYDNLQTDEIQLVVTSWDCANKSGGAHDWSVNCVVAKLANGTLAVLDVWRDRVGFDQLPGIMLARYYALAQRYGTVPLLTIEDAAAGTQAIQLIEANHRQIPLLSAKPVASKPIRAMGVTPLTRGGIVALPRDAPWRDGFVKELAEFSAGRWDDQVDAFVNAAKVFIGAGDFRKADFEVLPGRVPTEEDELLEELRFEYETAISPDLDAIDRLRDWDFF